MEYMVGFQNLNTNNSNRIKRGGSHVEVISQEKIFSVNVHNSYAKLYNIPSTGLRFFTVYDSCGRPDIVYFGFTGKLRAKKTI